MNINNVVLHIPALEPRDYELDDPFKYLKKLKFMRNEMLMDLTTIKFDVKIIDYGLSRILPPGELAETPAGTPECIAPEIGEMEYDQRVDTWGVGIIFYMCLTMGMIFSGEA